MFLTESIFLEDANLVSISFKFEVFLTLRLKCYGFYTELLELLYTHHFRIAYSNKKFFRAYETNQNTA